MITHLGCIMDGNRRWAKKQGLKAWLGHREGVAAAKRTITFCLDNNIKYLTLYAFSIENFNRSSQERTFLFRVLAQKIRKQLPDFIKRGVNVQFIGERALFPKYLTAVCQDVEEQTKQLSNLFLSVLFCYGGQQEIVDAVKRIAQQVENKTLAVQDVSQQLFEKQLWMHAIPKPEVIVRTGGTRRLSNFLLYHAAYSELYFLDCLWPELTTQMLEQIASDFKTIQRNFGK